MTNATKATSVVSPASLSEADIHNQSLLTSIIGTVDDSVKSTRMLTSSTLDIMSFVKKATHSAASADLSAVGQSITSWASELK